MLNGEQCHQSLRTLKPEVYYLGGRINSVVDHPALPPHVNAATA